LECAIEKIDWHSPNKQTSKQNKDEPVPAASVWLKLGPMQCCAPWLRWQVSERRLLIDIESKEEYG